MSPQDDQDVSCDFRVNCDCVKLDHRVGGSLMAAWVNLARARGCNLWLVECLSWGMITRKKKIAGERKAKRQSVLCMCLQIGRQAGAYIFQMSLAEATWRLCNAGAMHIACRKCNLCACVVNFTVTKYSFKAKLPGILFIVHQPDNCLKRYERSLLNLLPQRQ